MMAARAEPQQMDLGTLLSGIAAVPAGLRGLAVEGMALDTRGLGRADLFLACAGTRHHGLDFLSAAAEAGAIACLGEPTPDWPVDKITEAANRAGMPVVPVEGLSTLAGLVAGRFYGDPSERLRVVGITGTNGKTSCAHFLAQALGTAEPCAVIGTLGNGFVGKLEGTTHTTPDPVRLQALLARFADEGASAVAMEVSSHALHQHRVAGIGFDVAVFTNLSRDHLDYHDSMESYGDAKARLFAAPGLRAAVINAADGFGRRLLATLPAGVRSIAYGVGETGPAGVDRWLTATDVTVMPAGLRLKLDGSWGTADVQTGVLGRFNAANLLAVLGVLLVTGVPLAAAVERLHSLRGVPGRMERFGVPGRTTAVVDYAHTPDALEQLLVAVREHCRGRLHCVFGCGGDRDTGKRPLMGGIAERLADVVVLTDDNPRSEDGASIVADILSGMERPDAAIVERDRARAIAAAIGKAADDDWVVVAGKGHEAHQQVGDLTLPFSDRDHVLRSMAGGDA